MQEKFQSYSKNQTNAIVIIVIVMVVALLCIQQYLINKYPPVNKDKELVESIKSLENKIDSISNIRDSLILVVDTTKVKIIELEKKHETIRDSIITQSVNSDCISFSEYISKYNNRLSSSNNTQSIKNR